MAIFEQGNKLARQHAESPQDNLIAKLLDGTVDGESLSEMEFVTFFLLLIGLVDILLQMVMQFRHS